MCLHLQIDMHIQCYEWNPSYSSFVDQTMAQWRGADYCTDYQTVCIFSNLTGLYASNIIELHGYENSTQTYADAEVFVLGIFLGQVKHDNESQTNELFLSMIWLLKEPGGHISWKKWKCLIGKFRVPVVFSASELTRRVPCLHKWGVGGVGERFFRSCTCFFSCFFFGWTNPSCGKVVGW